MTRRECFSSKSDTIGIFCLEIWICRKKLIKIWLFSINFFPKIWSSLKNVASKTCFSKEHELLKKLLRKNLIFQLKFELKIWFVEKITPPKSHFPEENVFEIWQDEKISIQNLACCKSSISSSDRTKQVLFQSLTRCENFDSKSDFLFSFGVLA